MPRDLRIRKLQWRVRRERASLRPHLPGECKHPAAQGARVCQQRADSSAPFPQRRRTQAVSQRIAVASSRAGALAVAAVERFGNKIVRRFLAFFAHHSPPYRRARKRRRDDGRNWVRTLVLAHQDNIGMTSEVGIVSQRKVLSH
jgi:hypothetical protein